MTACLDTALKAFFMSTLNATKSSSDQCSSMCALLKVKAADFFQPLQFGVVCHAGAEKVTLG